MLLYALPAKSTSARVNLWRRLNRFGAVQLKTSTYVLPEGVTHHERFQWLSEEIRSAGGEASLLRVTEVEGIKEEEMVRMFNDARKEDYNDLIVLCRDLTNVSRRSKAGELALGLEKLHRRFNEILEIDYFKSSAADDARMALNRVGKLLSPKQRQPEAPRLSPRKYLGKTWLTRPRPGIDRAGSAWLIRKFIDAKAKFAFATEPSMRPDAVPFDMANVEFSHHGDDCTFETLVKRFGISDKAVLQMGTMVHDADLEDGKFQKFECMGINCVLAGWERTGLSDSDLLAKGIECFDGLHRYLRK